jgi:hypothetical protein
MTVHTGENNVGHLLYGDGGQILKELDCAHLVVQTSLILLPVRQANTRYLRVRGPSAE